MLARAFGVLEEVVDVGACYCFVLYYNRLVFITGEYFYEGARFPSLDFSLVHLLDDAGQTVDLVIEKRGAKTRPARTIPASMKQSLELPDVGPVTHGERTDGYRQKEGEYEEGGQAPPSRTQRVTRVASQERRPEGGRPEREQE